jgi:hypothetical protein
MDLDIAEEIPAKASVCKCSIGGVLASLCADGQMVVNFLPAPRQDAQLVTPHENRETLPWHLPANWDYSGRYRHCYFPHSNAGPRIVIVNVVIRG